MRKQGRCPYFLTLVYRGTDTGMAQAWSKTFYDSAQWKATRRAALVRDRYTCQLCGARAEEVHHITELTPLNIKDVNITLNLDNLQSLCHECHTRITKGEVGDCADGFVFNSDGLLVRLSDQ